WGIFEFPYVKVFRLVSILLFSANFPKSLRIVAGDSNSVNDAISGESSGDMESFTARHQKAHGLHCLRSDGHEEFENSQENLGMSSVIKEAKQKDIWNLYKEAQQNILFLNKQRLAAVEESEKLKKEKDELVERINRLEAESQTVIKKDKSSLLWELLLRIDSMVINGLIGTEEASSMRNLVREHEVDISEFPLDVLQQGDAKVLAELRRVPNKGKRYFTLDLDEIEGLKEIEADAYSYFNGQLHANRIWNGVVSGIGVTLIQPLYYVSMFSRDKVYGYPDDIDRFAYFSRASLDYIAKSGKQPDVLHIHNWQTAIVGPLFWDVFVNQGLEMLVPPEKLELCGLDPASLHRLDRLQDNTNPQVVNILKGGIVYSNKVVIMSSSVHHRSIPGLEPTLARQLGLVEDASTTTVGCIFSEISDVDLESFKSLVLSTTMTDVEFVIMLMNEDQMIIRELEKIQDEIKLKALRYGTAPVELNPQTEAFWHFRTHEQEATTAKFISSLFRGMSLSQALDLIKKNRRLWELKIMEAMEKDLCCNFHISAYISIKNL
ncbi:unnamed protein product, partial [Thlaspi arvense]